MNIFLEEEFRGFQEIQEFKSFVENQIDKKIKELRTVNGGEFCGNDFEQFRK